MPRGRGGTGLGVAEWRALPESGRALRIRCRADEQMIAIEQQHERIVEFTRAVHQRSLLSLGATTELTRGSNDVGFLFTAVRRFSRVIELVHASALPGTGRLRLPIRLYESAVAAATPVRDFLEHFDEGIIQGRGGIGYGTGPDMVTITYAGETIQTHLLLKAARDLHREVRAVVDPLAAGDVHWQPSVVPPGGLAADGEERSEPAPRQRSATP